MVVKSRSRCCRSVREEASCCHPVREVPGSFSSGSLGGGLATRANSCQLGGVNPGRAGRPSAAWTAALQTRRAWVVAQHLHDVGGHFWVSFLNHWEAICPTGPESRRAGPRCAPQTQPSHRQREGRCCPRHITARVLSDPQDVEQT